MQQDYFYIYYWTNVALDRDLRPAKKIGHDVLIKIGICKKNSECFQKVKYV